MYLKLLFLVVFVEGHLLNKWLTEREKLIREQKLTRPKLSFEDWKRFEAEYKKGQQNEDVKLNITQLIRKYGHPVEEHIVTTDDGYILTLFRIPNKDAAVAFLMHGLMGSSDDYIIAGPESGLAYILADAGYDVWLGNARGNKHSRKHKKLGITTREYWDFSWHEIGYYDLASSIDYVLRITNKMTLKYIGHSQGTTSFFVLTSERPEYNGKISLMIALSPVAWMSNIKSPGIRLFAPIYPYAHIATKLLGIHEIRDDHILVTISKAVCDFPALADVVCSNAMFEVMGYDFQQMNVTNLPVLLSHEPAGASIKQFVHYGQEVESGKFRRFDYGEFENIMKYNTKEPPNYNVSVIRAPVALIYSDGDWLSDPVNVETLHRSLGNVVMLYKVPLKNFNHLDYLIAKDVKRLLYDKLLVIMGSY